MMRLINDVSSYRAAVNSWTLAQVTVTSGQTAPDGSLTAFKIVTTSNDPNLIHPYISVVDSKYMFGVWLWTDSGQPFFDYTLTIASSGGAGSLSFATSTFSISNTPKLYQLSVDSLAGGNFQLRVDGKNSSVTSGNYFYMWQPHAAPTRQYMELLSEWDFDDGSKKIENEHRVRSGKRYVYKWGNYNEAKFGIQYVSSADRFTLNNSWWLSNQKLLFVDTPGTFAWNVQMTNDSKPIGKYQKPYINLWKGVIELEGY